MLNVSWDDAAAYAKWLSEKTGKTYRLPSESEWEYAARAGTKTLYWWGDKVSAEFASCKDCGGEYSKLSPPSRCVVEGESVRPGQHERRHVRVGPGLLE